MGDGGRQIRSVVGRKYLCKAAGIGVAAGDRNNGILIERDLARERRGKGGGSAGFDDDVKAAVDYMVGLSS